MSDTNASSFSCQLYIRAIQKNADSGDEGLRPSIHLQGPPASWPCRLIGFRLTQTRPFQNVGPTLFYFNSITLMLLFLVCLYCILLHCIISCYHFVVKPLCCKIKVTKKISSRKKVIGLRRFNIIRRFNI